ncbi:MAG: hypothetical protein PHY29_02860 [Syntrophales bacterium]|nr:hypothetical protein [Syntrophales bacterium]
MEAEDIKRNTDLPAIADDTLIAVAQNAEKRIEAVKTIKKLALKVTNGLDWVNMGGKPYLQSSGAEKIARLFGISWQIDEPTMTGEEGGHFTYTYTGIFSLGGISIEAVGTRSSKDPFFSRSHGDDVPPSEIDHGDVKKAAFTNLTANGITRLLGIRNMTVDELSQAGITMGKGVEYGQGGQGNAAGDVPADLPTDAHKHLYQTLSDYCDADTIKMAELLRKLSSFTDDKGEERYIKLKFLKGAKETWAGRVLGDLRKYVEKHPKQAPEPESDKGQGEL